MSKKFQISTVNLSDLHEVFDRDKDLFDLCHFMVSLWLIKILISKHDLDVGYWENILAWMLLSVDGQEQGAREMQEVGNEQK